MDEMDLKMPPARVDLAGIRQKYYQAKADA
jgi:hypothetical protein